MGLPIVTRLAAAGYEVTVFDVDAAVATSVRSSGASWAESAPAAARAADVLVTVLPGPTELRDAMLGENGALAYMRAGAYWLDLTSNDPRVASEVATQAISCGVHSVGAPMGGGVTAAETGELEFFVGGDAAAVEAVRPLLAVLGARASLTYLGSDIGAGYTAKLLANLLWFGQAVATTEALLLGQALGLDLATLRTTLGASAGGSVFLDRYVDSLLAGDYLESFGIDRVVEELDTVTALAETAGVPFELSTLVMRLHREALSRFGPVDGELLAAKLLEERANTTLRVG